MKQDILIKETIHRETMIGEIVEKYPEVIGTLKNFGVHCVGCHISPFESLEMGFKGHGMSDKEVDNAVKQLNAVISKAKKQEIQLSSLQKNLYLMVTDAAALRIRNLLKKERKKAFRLGIKSGGCSGHEYVFGIEDKQRSNDVIVTAKDVKVYVDKASIEKLNGSTLDYYESLQGSGFKVINPNATSTCGCGTSFS